RSSVSVSHTDRVLCIGSCFAEQIGGRLERLKFPVLTNPNGIVFNPVSIGQSLERLASGGPFSEADLFENQGLWHSFDHHGRFSHPDKTAALEGINRSFSRAKDFLTTCNRLVVTLGTAHVFILKKSGEIVANCHKVPGEAFERGRLPVAEVVGSLVGVFEKLKANLPALEIIATVSPVRHLRDGLVENQRSKAALLLALDEICRRLPFVHYFPAYEILLDDLRDYRFYDADLSHPNQLATDYIWQYFEGAFLEEKTSGLCRRIEQLRAALEHRPFHPQSTEHQVFVKKQLEAVEQLEAAFPFLDFGQERRQLGGF
ncbi:MAG: GSCFA domain-containing protein, partial [Bacteroidetes bacterium]|nr:GSCFA domain-containing protein [Bacteroidota bacterium]